MVKKIGGLTPEKAKELMKHRFGKDGCAKTQVIKKPPPNSKPQAIKKPK